MRAVNSVTFTVGEGEADILNPLPPGNVVSAPTSMRGTRTARHEPASGNGRK
jgi:hypothetical protein